MSGAVVWLTGLPSSGKSTLAHELFTSLRRSRRAAALLDGDEVRDALVPRPGYSAAERDAFYATLGRLAALLARQGLIVAVAATAHRRAWREAARSLSPRFIEVFIDVPPDECRARDAKGLYAQGVRDLPGADLQYEAPESPDVVASGGEDAAALREILRRLSSTAAASGATSTPPPAPAARRGAPDPSPKGAAKPH